MWGQFPFDWPAKYDIHFETLVLLVKSIKSRDTVGIRLVTCRRLSVARVRVQGMNVIQSRISKKLNEIMTLLINNNPLEPMGAFFL